MNDNSFVLPSCSDSRRRTRRLTTDQSRPPFCSANDNVVIMHLLASYHSLRGIHIICVVNNVVKLYIIVTV